MFEKVFVGSYAFQYSVEDANSIVLSFISTSDMLHISPLVALNEWATDVAQDKFGLVRCGESLYGRLDPHFFKLLPPPPTKRPEAAHRY
jgi:hypothetical protein